MSTVTELRNANRALVEERNQIKAERDKFAGRIDGVEIKLAAALRELREANEELGSQREAKRLRRPSAEVIDTVGRIRQYLAPRPWRYLNEIAQALNMPAGTVSAAINRNGNGIRRRREGVRMRYALERAQ